MADKKGIIDEIKEKVSLGAKLALIGVILGVLMILKSMVADLVDERSRARDGAIAEIAEKWGGDQLISGPVLVVPYKEVERIEDFATRSVRFVTHTRYATFLPEDLKIKGSLAPELRRRGIYEAVLYVADLDITGSFRKPNLESLRLPAADVIWKDALLSFGVKDTHGIREQVTLRWNGKDFGFAPGSGEGSLLGAGMQVKGLPLEDNKIDFSFKLSLNGSQDLKFLPLGRNTSVELASSWKDPGFSGEYLPLKREITEKGFTATWKVLELARPFPQQWTSKQGIVFGFDDDSAHQSKAVMPVSLAPSAFGVRLVIPAGAYQQNERAIKYAFLFILLTFTAFFLFEVQGGLRLHPMQYLLVGCALVVFYLLLLSVSEHLGYNAAYGLATLAILATVGGYCRAILGQGRKSLVITGLLTWLYAYLFVVLRLEDYALLMGSLAVFISLAAVMWLTRKIDWYGLGKK